MISTPEATHNPLSGLDVRSRRQNVLYVATTRHFGGLEVASIRLAELLMRTNPEQLKIVFACRPQMPVELRCRELGIPTTELTVRNSGDLSGVRALVQIVKDHGIGIIHVHSRRDYVIAVLAVAKLRKELGREIAPKLMLQMHLLRSLGSPSFVSGYFFAPHVDRYVAVSQAVRNYLVKQHRQIDPNRICVVPNSVEPDVFRLDPIAGQSIRTRYGIPADAVVAGMVGRLDTKGQREAITALGYQTRSNVYLLLVGNSGRKGYVNRLKALAEKLGIGARVVICGAQQDVAAHLSAMDIFLHLPKDEAFGLAPAEAMAAGLPVLVSNVGGCLELVTDGETGLMANPKNPVEVRSKLRELIDSPELRERLAAAGGEFVRSRFTTQAQAEILMKIYDQLVGVEAGAASSS